MLACHFVLLGQREGKMTPEGKVKQVINSVLACYPESYVFMSVPFGYGPSTLDYLVCHYGRFVAIEAKKPGGIPTDRQDQILAQIQIAGGRTFVVDGPDKLAPLSLYLEQVKRYATSQGQPQAPASRGAAGGKYPKPISKREALDTWRRSAHSPAAPADGDLPAAADGVRRSESDPDAL
jgi:hypothetical protein